MDREITRTTVYLTMKARTQLAELCEKLDEKASGVIRQALNQLHKSLIKKKKAKENDIN